MNDQWGILHCVDQYERARVDRAWKNAFGRGTRRIWISSMTETLRTVQRAV